MQGSTKKEIRKTRDKGKKDIVLYICTVLLAAAIIVLNMMARIEIIKLSDESVTLTSQITELEETLNTLKIEYEFTYNLGEIERLANEMNMIPPSEIGAEFIDKHIEDETVVYSDNTEVMDKPNVIYAYFGW